MGRRVWALTVDGGHYIDAGGERRFRFSIEDGSLRLTCVGFEGDLELRVPGRAPGARRMVRRGDLIEFALAGTELPPALIVVQRVQRRFAGVWSPTNP